MDVGVGDQYITSKWLKIKGFASGSAETETEFAEVVHKLKSLCSRLHISAIFAAKII